MKLRITISLVPLLGVIALLMVSNTSSINTSVSASKSDQHIRAQPINPQALGTRLLASDPHFLQSDGTGPMETYDDRLARVGAQVPGFGGMFYKGGTLMVYMKNQEGPVDQNSMILIERAITNEIFVGQPQAEEGLEIIRGRYDFLQLKAWHDQISPFVLGIPGVVSTDIADDLNLLRIGIQDQETIEMVREDLNKLGVPNEAVVIEITEPIVQQLQARRRPLVGGLQINFPGFLCTLGFIANRTGVRGFATNSHCTATQGGVQNTVYDQPVTSGTTNRVGIEIADPTYFTGGQCPAGRQCRFSDSSFVEVPHPSGPATTTSLGIIARPPSGNTTWNGVDIFTITATGDPAVGQAAAKVGRTTGRTDGSVQSVCVNTNVGGTDITQLCQTIATFGSGAGDSGSAVFQITSGNNVTLRGLFWGSNGTTAAFSPFSAVQNELGILTVR